MASQGAHKPAKRRRSRKPTDGGNPVEREWTTLQKTVVGTIATLLLAGILKAGDVVTAVKDIHDTIWSAPTAVPPPPTAVPVPDMVHDTNTRFNFTFDRPRYWDRRGPGGSVSPYTAQDPTNADGALFDDPQRCNQPAGTCDVFYSVWGSYESTTPPGLGSYIAFVRRANPQTYKGYHLLAEGPAGRNGLIWFTGPAGTPTAQQMHVDGWRLVFTYHDDTSRPMTAVEEYTAMDGTIVGGQCAALTTIYPSYESLCLRLLASITPVHGRLPQSVGATPLPN